MNKLNLFVLCILTVTCSYVAAKEKVVVCYYGTWATYRHGDGQFDVAQINTDLCTHLIYTFVGINNQGVVISLDPWLDLPDNWGRDNFRKFNALKQYKPSLKTLLAVGGWNEGSAKYSVMAASPTLRNNFITSAIEMVLKYGFDGFDIDWEYPNGRDSVYGKADIDNFTLLLKEMRAEFDKHGLLLSAAVAAAGSVAASYYNIPAFTQYVDYVNLMTYDMYGAWDSVTGHNAPLHKGQGDENVARENVFTVDLALEYWLQQGCPADKLVLGIPLYGRTFQLTNANNNGVRAPASGAGIAGPWTATSGFIGYNEFCLRLKTESWDLRYDSLAKVPYAVQGRNWVSYDDPNSIAVKIEHALQYNIAGAMIWSIETDDFRGKCAGDFPLLRAINQALGKYSATTTPAASSTTTTSTTTTTTTTPKPAQTSTTTTSQPTTTSTTTTTQPAQTTTTTTSRPATSSTSTTTLAPSSSVCQREGFNPDPTSCNSFYVCVMGGYGVLVPHRFTCSADLHWDQQNLVCNYSHQANCKN
ncbi:probable chitinase 2 [Pararge aegeria]|uniref:chitinase n=1 Tax=Pararge aegeria aegeria TaxID=348720 RepID=A0A8S4RQF9_9NEOP|nr:probable chitinase 2 [Pararge aegeria]CAH2239666.1 jg12442 [Pararge aegeria aegeria]